MKKILTILLILLIGAFAVCALYVFNIFPFHSEPAPIVQPVSQNLPSYLQEQGVSRNKSSAEYFARAQLLEQNNFPTLAISEYQNAYNADTTSLTPLFRIGQIYLNTNDYIKAQNTFQQILGIDKTNTEAQIQLGKSLIGERNLNDQTNITQAKTIFDAITVPTQESKYYQGILAAFFADYDNSQKLLQDSANLNTSPDITNKANNFLAAFKEYKANVDSGNLHLKTLLGRSFAQTEEYNLAIPILYQVIQNKKDYRDAWVLLGYSYMKIEKNQDAVDALEEAKTLDPTKPETLFFLGLAYYSLNDYQKAVDNLELAKTNGFQPSIQVDQKLAEVYLLLNNFPKSAKSYEQVLTLNNEDVNYYVKPVWLYIEKLNQPENALKLAQKAVDTHPKEAMSYNLLGWSYIANNMLDQAESNLRHAMALNPELDATYLNYGILLEKKGQPQNALNFYKKANLKGKGNSISVVAATRYNNLIAQMKISGNNSTAQANILSN